MRKKILEKKLKRLMDKKQSLAARAQASQDVAEVRSINETLEDINAEIEETQAEIDAINEAEKEQNEPEENPNPDQRQIVPPAGAQLVNPLASFKEEKREKDVYATLEYRQAFMAYVQKGTPIPEEYDKRDAANTESIGATIPTTVLNEFIKEVEDKAYGQLYNKVRKLNVKGGVKIPLSKLQAQFKWITESTASPRQDGGDVNEYVMFEYNVGEIRVAQTLLSSIVAIEMFEKEITQVMIDAFLQAMDDGIINGTGNGQMLGILHDPRVLNDPKCTVEMTAAEFDDWKSWKKKLFATLPIKSRKGEFVFPVSTVDTHLETMADANNRPIFREATGLEVGDNASGRFFGRELTLVEPDIIADFDAAEAGDCVGVYWQPKQYGINIQYAMGIKRYFDEENNEYVNKLLVVVDGKPLNKNGIRIIRKKGN